MARDRSMRWFEEQRIEWIAETLRIFGYINREHLMKKFMISTAQAAHDFSEFQKIKPGTMEYDKHAKCYIAK